MEKFYFLVFAFLCTTSLVLAASPDLTATLRRLENVLLGLRSKQLAVVDVSRGQSDVTKPEIGTNFIGNIDEKISAVNLENIICPDVNCHKTPSENLKPTVTVDPKYPWSTYWTSGFDKGSPKDDARIWCSSDSKFTSDVKIVHERLRENGMNCLYFLLHAMSRVETGLQWGFCGVKRNFICEDNAAVKTTCTALQCAGSSCVKNPDEKIIDNQLRQAKSMNYCGKNYYAFNISLTFPAALAYCCNLGLKLLSVETREEQICVANFYRSMHYFDPKKNGIYWTSATNAVCGGKYSFSWCTSNASFPADVTWSETDPNNEGGEENCVGILLNAQRGSDCGLVDVHCTEPKGRFFICEDDAPLNKNALPIKTVVKTETSVCTAFKCSAPCVKNITYFDQKGNLMESKIVGMVKKNWDEKDLYYFKQQMVFQDAWTTCCNIGKKLATFESKSKLDCAIQVLKDLDSSTSLIWAGGLSEECNKKFLWCLKTPETISKKFWAKLEPNNDSGQEYAVALNLKEGFHDEAYSTKLAFLCE